MTPTRLTALAAVSLVLSLGAAAPATAQELSPYGVKTLAPAGAIKTTGTWSLGTRAGDFVYIAGGAASTLPPTRWSPATSLASARPSST
jgi:2-iminobutanoate/2-iminopropanoate deaminase